MHGKHQSCLGKHCNILPCFCLCICELETATKAHTLCSNHGLDSCVFFSTSWKTLWTYHRSSLINHLIKNVTLVRYGGKLVLCLCRCDMCLGKSALQKNVMFVSAKLNFQPRYSFQITTHTKHTHMCDAMLIITRSITVDTAWCVHFFWFS